MADLKISQLNSIVTVVPATDVLPVVQGGTTLKITPKQILESGSPAVLASATITGAATVTGAANLNGAVNLSTSGTPTVTLGATATYGVLVGSGTNAASIYINGATRPGFNSVLQFGAAEHQFYNSSLSSLIATLNTTALGIGVAPVAGRGAIQLSAGVGFPATQVASADANTLDDYEEGTWIPTDASGAGLVFTLQNCRYTKIGRAVTVQGSITYPATVNASNALWGGFPFNAADIITLSVIYTDASLATFTYLSGNTGNVYLLTPGVNTINSTVSGKTITFSGTYMV